MILGTNSAMDHKALEDSTLASVMDRIAYAA